MTAAETGPVAPAPCAPALARPAFARPRPYPTFQIVPCAVAHSFSAPASSRTETSQWHTAWLLPLPVTRATSRRPFARRKQLIFYSRRRTAEHRAAGTGQALSAR